MARCTVTCCSSGWRHAPVSGQRADPAGVYRLLKQMEHDSLLHGTQEPGRTASRRLFSLTERGRACLLRWMDTLEQHQASISRILDFCAARPVPDQVTLEKLRVFKGSFSTTKRKAHGYRHNFAKLRPPGRLYATDMHTLCAPAWESAGRQALGMGAAFGSGMGHAETCGCVTGALLVLGLQFGPQNEETAATAAERLQEQVAVFEERFLAKQHSLIAKEIWARTSPCRRGWPL